MKFYLHHPVVTPQRFVTDHTTEEQIQFREAFQPLAKRYRRFNLIVGMGFVSGAICLVLAMNFKDTWFIWPLVGIFICSLLLVLCSVFVGCFRMPSCPACHNAIWETFGAYCPECGAKTLDHRTWPFSPRCLTCGQSMRRGRRRLYKIRACTHCGVMLDEIGL